MCCVTERCVLSMSFSTGMHTLVPCFHQARRSSQSVVQRYLHPGLPDDYCVPVEADAIAKLLDGHQRSEMTVTYLHVILAVSTGFLLFRCLGASWQGGVLNHCFWTMLLRFDVGVCVPTSCVDCCVSPWGSGCLSKFNILSHLAKVHALDLTVLLGWRCYTFTLASADVWCLLVCVVCVACVCCVCVEWCASLWCSVCVCVCLCGVLGE